MFREYIEQLGEAGINLFKAVGYIIRGRINKNEVAIQIIKTGIGSIFLTSLTSYFVGLVLTLQMIRELRDYGAENFVGAVISTAAIRELGPVISAIIVAGRVGSSVSAEIGSMKASEQIDALIIFGIDPIRYLIVPRLLGLAIITPLLCALSTFVCIMAGMFLAHAESNISYDLYLFAVRMANTVNDVLVMLLKGCIFGITIAIIATTAGLQVQGGAEAVGEGTTKTIVWCFILIFILNYFMSSVFFRI